MGIIPYTGEAIATERPIKFKKGPDFLENQQAARLLGSCREQTKGKNCILAIWLISDCKTDFGNILSDLSGAKGTCQTGGSKTRS